MAYQVLVQGESMNCNCRAGQNGRMCTRVAGVRMQMEAEAALEQARSIPQADPDLEAMIAELY